MTDLGRILLLPKGAYDPSASYELLDVVTYQRNTYVCKSTTSITGIAPTDTTNWQIMSEHGADAFGYGYIRYSEYADGTNFVTTPTADTKYIGFYMGNSVTPPTSKTDYTWSKYVGEDGRDGADGQDGQNGNVWGTGTALTGTGTNLTGYAGIVGDCYLNTTSSNVYQCTASGTISTAKWSYICNIKGNSGSGSGDMESDTYAPTAKSQGLSNVVDSALSLNGLTASVTELNYMDGVTSAVQTQLNDKVNAVSGKGLSTEDYTTSEKTKLSGIASGAEVNAINSADSNFSVSNRELSLSSQVTSKLSNFNTDGSIASGSELDDALDLKADASNVYTKAQVDSKVDVTAKTSTVGSDGKTVSFTGIDTSKTYELYADVGTSFSDISPVGIQSMTLNGTTLTYVLTNASSGMSCKLREIKL